MVRQTRGVCDGIHIGVVLGPCAESHSCHAPWAIPVGDFKAQSKRPGAERGLVVGRLCSRYGRGPNTSHHLTVFNRRRLRAR
jgi:hypothetical protein